MEGGKRGTGEERKDSRLRDWKDRAGQFSEATFDAIDEQHYTMENALLRQIESLQAKQRTGEWDDNLFLREDELTYILNQID